MAFLQNLIVTGGSKFLNKIYATDIEVDGTFETSGNLSVGGTLDVAGTTTLKAVTTTCIDNSGTFINRGGLELISSTPFIDFRFGKSTSDYTSRIIEEASGTITIKPNLKVGTSATIPTATITTANITTGNLDSGTADNFNVTNKLHATHFDLQSVAQLGGAFYVSPTIKFPTDSNTTFTITKSGATANIIISDSAITSTTLAGVVWGTNAKVKASGKIGTVTTGTMDGTVTGINTSNHTLTISVSGENSSSITAGTYTSTNIDNFCVMMYNTGTYPVGIMMNSYGTDGRTYIDIHGGTSSATEPNVRIGNLGGLSFNGTTLSNQWGIYTNNGYYTGSIVANGGKIGGFTIGSTAIYTGTLTANSDNNIGLSSADFTRTIGNTSRSGLRFAIGDKVGITGDGVLYGSNIQVTGGKIGGWNIGSDYLYNQTSVTTGTPSTQYGLRLVTGNNATTLVIKAGSRTYDGTNYGAWTDKFYVRNDGYMYAVSGSIGNWVIGNNALYKGTIGTANGVFLIPAGSTDSYSIGGSESIADWTITSGANFGVTASGAVYCSDIHATGEITATSGYIGDSTNGFTIDSSGFYSGSKTSNTSGYISLSNTAFTRTINDASISNLRFAIGSKFGITNDGTLYASGANIKNINADNINMGTISIERLTSLEIGGRNLLETNNVSYSSGSYGAYRLFLTEPLESGVQYVLQLWDVNVSNTKKTDATLGVNVYYCAGSVSFGGWIGTDYFTNGHADYLKLIFTPYTNKNADSSGGSINPSGNLSHNTVINSTNKSICLYNSAPLVSGAVYSMSVGKWKLEKGNKATDWSLAPEESQTAIEAAETALSQSSEYILGTQTASTGSWTGVSNTITELKDGIQIRYWLPYAGSGNATLNLTLKNGTTTGAIPIYRQGGYASSTGVVTANRVTTHYPAGSSISMTYGVNRVVSAVYSGTTYTGTFTGWFVDGAYDSGNTYNRIRLQNTITAQMAITSGHIICGTDAGYRHIAANVTFDLSFPLLWAGSNIAVNNTGDNNYLEVNGVNASTSGAITSGAVKKMLYLKGTVNNNMFVIAGSPFLTASPSVNDNCVYIPLGIMYSTTGIYFISSNKLYGYVDGNFKELARGEAALAARTATNYLYYDNTNGLIISSSASAQTYSGASTGYNTRLTNSALQIRNGTNVLASYGSTITIGKSGNSQQVIDNTTLKFKDGKGDTQFTINNNTTGYIKDYKAQDLILEAPNSGTGINKTTLATALYNYFRGYTCTSNSNDYCTTTNNCRIIVKLCGGYLYNEETGPDYSEMVGIYEFNLTGLTFTLNNNVITATKTTSGDSASSYTTIVNNYIDKMVERLDEMYQADDATYEATEADTDTLNTWVEVYFEYPIISTSMTLGTRSGNLETGCGSLSVGKDNNITGNYSVALGEGLEVNSDYSTVIGSYNLPLYNSNTGLPEEVAFAVGAGDGSERNRRTPFAVLKNGTVVMSNNNANAGLRVTVAPNTKETIVTPFAYEMPFPPFIFLTLESRGKLNNIDNIKDMGKVQIYLHEVTTKNFTVYIINNGNRSHEIGWRWFAICTN